MKKLSSYTPALNGNVLSGLIALGILASIALGCTCGKNLGTSNTPSKSFSTTGGDNGESPATASTTKKTGDEFVVGYMQYKVFDSWYADRLSANQYLNDPPDAQYLFVDLGVGNVDKEERTVPPFKLVDDTGAEYGTSDKGWRAKDSIGLLQNLNPGVAKRAYVIFDVPPGRNYKLKVSGGYWSSDEMLIELTPRPLASGKKKK